MTATHQRAVRCILPCLFLLSLACTRRIVSAPIPSTAPPRSTQSMEPDQVNTARWEKGWTNLLNDAEQSFTPGLSKMVAVEVELLVGNPGIAADELTLTVLDPAGQAVAAVVQTVRASDSGRVLFVIPKGGVVVSPGQTYRLRVSGGSAFGWKYVVGGYEHGEATFNGRPLVAEARTTFLFRTFGPK